MATNLSSTTRKPRSNAARALARAFPPSMLGKNYKRYKNDRYSFDIDEYIENHPDYAVGEYTTPAGNTYAWFPIRHENIARTLGNAAYRAYKKDGFVVRVRVDPDTGDLELAMEAEHKKK